MHTPRKHVKEHLEAELVRLAAEYINRESNRSSLITPLSAIVDERNSKAVILVAISPKETEEYALDFLKRSRPEFRKFIEERGTIARAPFIDFELDKSAGVIDALSSLSN